jgi:hypothetical protein
VATTATTSGEAEAGEAAAARGQTETCAACLGGGAVRCARPRIGTVSDTRTAACLASRPLAAWPLLWSWSGVRGLEPEDRRVAGCRLGAGTPVARWSVVRGSPSVGIPQSIRYEGYEVTGNLVLSFRPIGCKVRAQSSDLLPRTVPPRARKDKVLRNSYHGSGPPRNGLGPPRVEAGPP